MISLVLLPPKLGEPPFFCRVSKDSIPVTDKMSMIIQGSHMNVGFMQKLKAQQAQGESLGSAESLLNDSAGMRLGSGMHIDAPRQDAVFKGDHMPGKLPEKAAETLGQTVANEIVRRMRTKEDENGKPKDVNGLRQSIGSTVDWLSERFGEETATAAAGMLMGATSGEVDETAIGDGLLNTLKFIDRNFGYATGDAAIAKFNSGVNTELNEYFDNGQTEMFFAVEAAPAAEQPSATQDISARFFARAVQESGKDDKDTASLTEQLLAELKNELDEVAELQNLTSQLEAEFNPTSQNVQAAMAAYTDQTVPTEPQFTSLAV